MECLNCNNQVMIESNLRFEQELKGVIVEFVAPANKCPKCGMVVSTPEQKRTGMIRMADAYREKCKLLTSSEIREFRRKLGDMGQEKFAEFLGVGVASLKRWETYSIQDPSSDELIRLKCDSGYAAANLVQSLIAQDPSEANGKRRFNPDIFAHVLVKLLPYAKSPLFFFKAMFYVDFLHYKRHGVSVTGAPYRALDYGPVPSHYEAILDYMKIKGWFLDDGTTAHDLKKASIEFDDAKFSTDEIASIEDVLTVLKSKGARYVFEQSHSERPFTDTPSYTTISYSLARDLKLV
jgi:putative zinc finger/helix-turn-helix YgiT family protein